MDPGWDVKREAGCDIIKCQVIRSSISFRYHIGRQMLYTTFRYVRERLVKNVWVAMDHFKEVEMVALKVELLDGTSINLDVGKTWGFRDLREEISYYMDCNIKWSFGICIATKAGRWGKANTRQEKVTQVSDIGENNWLRIKAT
ncbi:unnamed protein product [Calypogeia fissa]